MKKLLAFAVLLVLALSGCTKIEPRPFVYPTYPEQDSVSTPRYEVSSGSVDSIQTYASERVSPSEIVPDYHPGSGVNNAIKNVVTFDIKKPVANQPFIALVTYKSNKPGYFVGVDEYGVVTEPILYVDKASTTYSFVDSHNKNTRAIRYFGDGDWTIDLLPISQLPEFSGELTGSGSIAFIVNGPTRKVEISSTTHTILIRSYGYENRVIGLQGGLGIQNSKTALPGNGAVIVLTSGGNWSITEVVEVENEED